MNPVKRSKAPLLLASYVMVLVVEIIAEQRFIDTGNASLLFITKPLLMPILILWAFLFATEKSIKINKLLILALLFSMFGDIFLMYVPFKPQLFIFGLGSFLIAHIFYITLFLKYPEIKKPQSKTINLKLLVISLIYVTLLLFYLYQQNNSEFLAMQIPVIVYAIVLMMMFISAFNLYQKTPKHGIWVLIGALLFVLSDTTIALSKFSPLFIDDQNFARIIIMSLYGIAQFMIVKGYLSSTITHYPNPIKL